MPSAEHFHEEAKRLGALVEELKVESEKAVASEAATAEALHPAEAELREAEKELEECSAALQGGQYRSSSEVRDAEETIERARQRARRFGASGAGTGEANPPRFESLPLAEAELGMDELVFRTFDVDGSGDIDLRELKVALHKLGFDSGTETANALAAKYDEDGSGSIEFEEFRRLVNEIREEDLKKVSGRQLDEVRQMRHPPQVIRRALELVQCLLIICEGGDGLKALLRPGGHGWDFKWNDLMAMIAKPVFVQSIAGLKASVMPIAMRPQLLDEIGRRWPGVIDDDDDDDAYGGNDEAAAASSAERSTGTGTGALMSSPVKKLSAAVSAGRVEEDPEEATLSAEAVGFASRPCAALYSWCHYVVNLARSISRERPVAQAELDAALRRCSDLKSELLALDLANRQLSTEELALNERRAALLKAFEAARTAHDEALERRNFTVKRLAEVQKAARSAAWRAKKEEEFEVMRAEASEQRKRDKLEAERLAQSEEEARATLAAHTPSPEELNALAWVVRRSLPRARPVEFAPHGADVPAGIEEALSELADEMRGDPSLHLHIAGHHTAEEEEANPRLSAMRAYAVGNALGMLGVRPSQLRAKGYHATVALTSGIRARLSIRSDRRVTVHAISEIRTRHPIAFAKKDASVDATAAEVLSEVAELLNKDPSLNLCIEGHTDEKDEKDPEQSVRLSRARAKAVQRHLLDLGVADDGSRLSCHGFGTTLPLHIKAKTEENRARNRRVQLLLVPDVRPEGSKPQVASRGAGIHLVRL